MALKINLIADNMIPVSLLPEMHGSCYVQNLFVCLREIGLGRMHDLAVRHSGFGFDQDVEVIG